MVDGWRFRVIGYGCIGSKMKVRFPKYPYNTNVAEQVVRVKCLKIRQRDFDNNMVFPFFTCQCPPIRHNTVNDLWLMADTAYKFTCKW